MAVFPRRFCDRADFTNASARAALPPAERTAGDQHRLRAPNLSGARAPPPAGAALYAAHPFGHARSGAHHAAARQPEAGARIRAEARRLDRGAARPAARTGAVRARRRDPVARRRPPHRAPARPARHGVGRERRASERLLCVAGEEPHVARRVSDFLKREVKSDLEAASRRAAEALGVAIKRVSIRDPSSRWGSCSTTGVLSYSWRLIFAPPFVLDYLAAHEVAHLVEMNHSPRVLAHRRAHLPARRARQVLARRPRRRPASLRHA